VTDTRPEPGSRRLRAEQEGVDAAEDVSDDRPGRGARAPFPADRKAAEEVIATRPAIRQGIHANREMLRQAVRHLAAEAGIRQFLDLGTGIPTRPNVHEVMQGVALEALGVSLPPLPCAPVSATSAMSAGSQPAPSRFPRNLDRI
jgi:hypothetical protein